MRRLLLAIVVAALLLTSSPAARAAPPPPATTSWPLPGIPEVVRGFDPPDSPWGRGHRGVDLAGAVGDTVLAAAAGAVTFAGMLAGRGVVVVDHGPVRTTYEPVTATVPAGSWVAAGEPIGRLQAGHCARQPCLHWGLKQGEKYLDPLLLAPDGSAGGRYRLLPATERDAATKRAEDRRSLQQQLLGIVRAPPSDRGRHGPAGSHGFRFPVAAPITLPYGMRYHPVLHVWKLHDGTDFGAGCGTPILAPYAGIVTERYFNVGYGNRLMVDHGIVDGEHVVSGFNHATSYVVGIGDRVAQGQLLGFVGTTGYSTGCHLHLMVWIDGQVADPMSWY
jgi:murein DD-endopeptidase MepM/ murein hydrolase activator NlpD